MYPADFTQKAFAYKSVNIPDFMNPADLTQKVFAYNSVSIPNIVYPADLIQKVFAYNSVSIPYVANHSFYKSQICLALHVCCIKVLTK